MATTPQGVIDLGGGDDISAEVRILADRLVEALRGKRIRGFSHKNFAKAVNNTRVHAYPHLKLDGRYVAFVQSKDESLIRVSVSAWEKIKRDPKVMTILVMHEYLGIMGLDDSKYQISSKVLKFLSRMPYYPVMWNVGDFQRFRLRHMFLGDVGTFVKQVVKKENGIVYVKSTMAIAKFGLPIPSFTIVAKIDELSGVVHDQRYGVSDRANLSMTLFSMNFGSSNPSVVSVPAGTFDSRYYRVATPYDSDAEMWLADEVSMDGTVKVIGRMLGISLTFELIDFGFGSGPANQIDSDCADFLNELELTTIRNNQFN